MEINRGGEERKRDDPFFQEEIVSLNSMSDLQKMTFKEIAALKIGHCRGDVFEAALKQAFELESQGFVSEMPPNQDKSLLSKEE